MVHKHFCLRTTVNVWFRDGTICMNLHIYKVWENWIRERNREIIFVLGEDDLKSLKDSTEIDPSHAPVWLLYSDH